MAREKSFLPPEEMLAEQGNNFEEEITERSEADQRTIEGLLAQGGDIQESPVQPQIEENEINLQEHLPQQPSQQESVAMTPQPVTGQDVDKQSQVKVNEPVLSGPTYTVQVGFFSVENNARGLAKEIEGQGYDTFVVPKDGNYKVQVGSYRTQEQAETASQQLKNLGYEIWVTKR